MNELALSLYLTLFAADGASTHQAFNFCAQRQTCTTHERFMTQSPVANEAILAGEASALWWATNKIKRPALKWTVRLGIAGIHGYAAAHNWQAIQKAR